MTFSAETISLIRQAILGACLLAFALFGLLLDHLGAFGASGSDWSDLAAFEVMHQAILILL